jgi:hypothetical protein
MARDVLAGETDVAANQTPGKQANLSGLLLPRMEVLWCHVVLCCVVLCCVVLCCCVSLTSQKMTKRHGVPWSTFRRC